MEKEFIPYEQALALKELGFNRRTLAQYNTRQGNEWILTFDFSGEGQFSGNGGPCVAPTFSQCFKWFRENYNIHHAMKPILGSKNGYDSFPILGWDYDIFVTNKETQNSYYMGYPVGEWFTATLDRFDEGETLEDLNIHPLTYEDAELECLKELIEIVKGKK
jgi:hypothetical protein